MAESSRTRRSMASPLKASTRRTPEETPRSPVTLNSPSSPVLLVCVPPQSSKEKSPMRTTRTRSPYFSPKSAMAPSVHLRGDLLSHFECPRLDADAMDSHSGCGKLTIQYLGTPLGAQHPAHVPHLAPRLRIEGSGVEQRLADLPFQQRLDFFFAT